MESYFFCKTAIAFKLSGKIIQKAIFVM